MVVAVGGPALFEARRVGLRSAGRGLVARDRRRAGRMHGAGGRPDRRSAGGAVAAVARIEGRRAEDDQAENVEGGDELVHDSLLFGFRVSIEPAKEASETRPRMLREKSARLRILVEPFL